MGHSDDEVNCSISSTFKHSYWSECPPRAHLGRSRDDVDKFLIFFADHFPAAKIVYEAIRMLFAKVRILELGLLLLVVDIIVISSIIATVNLIGLCGSNYLGWTAFKTKP